VNSQDIQAHIYNWAVSKNFSAPSGVLPGDHVNKKGHKFLSVSFGRARTLDATVEIYNRNFIILRTSNAGSEIYNDLATLMAKLETL